MSAGHAERSEDEDYPAPHQYEEHEEGEHGGDEEGWLVSYADLMTLLFGFFAMLFSYASFDDDSLIKVRKELAKFFGGMYANPALSQQQQQGKDGDKDGHQENKGKDELNGDGAVPSPVKDWDLKATEDGVEVAFVTTVRFLSGGSEIAPEARDPLRALVEVIRGITSGMEQKPQIRIEGHTDDVPLSGQGVFKSNWELSAARAGAVARFFEDAGFPPESLSASGYGSGRPIYPNRSPDGKPLPLNQEANRRVIIKVIMPKKPAPK